MSIGVWPCRVAGLVFSSAVLACAPQPRVGPEPATGRAPADPSPSPGRRGPAATDLAAVYRQMGLIAGRGELPFVGSVAHFAARSPDTTLVLLTLSLPNRALTFAREGDRYRAPYEVRLDVRRGTTSVRQVASDEVVRVPTFKETTRTDESVLFHQYFTLAPGAYTLSVAMRDVESGRSSAVEVPLAVPAVGARALSTPVVVYDATPRTRLDTFPRIVASARAAVTFGQDSVAPIYVEGYTDSAVDAPARLPLRVVARGERDVVVWTDTVALDRQPSATPAAGAARGLYGGVVRVPVARVGIGVVSLTVSRAGGPADEGAGGGADSARTTIFVNLGEDLPITAFGEALDYLRYYAAPERLRALRDAAPEARAVAWAAFLRESDPVTATAEHEGLREYFARIRAANARFSEDGGPGWLSDRGMAFVGVGEPDQIFDPGGPDINVRGRQQIWEYRSPRLQLVFVDQTGFGRWRLAPSSLVEVQSIIRRRQVR